MLHNIFSTPVYFHTIPPLYKRKIDEEINRFIKDIEEESDPYSWNEYIKTSFHNGKNDILTYSMYLLADLFIHYAREINNQREIQIDNSWFNFSYRNNSQNTHLHPCFPHAKSDIHLSGVYFHQVHENSGDLILKNSNPVNQWVNFNSEETIVPQNGMLVLFQSWVPHSVTINKTDKPRISVSANLSGK
ncbi:MAG: putative 2OG-Fe(II) oxygenase [Candidatus Kariarchaeum pelagius]